MKEERLWFPCYALQIMRSTLASPSLGQVPAAKASLETFQAGYPTTASINDLKDTLTQLRTGTGFYGAGDNNARVGGVVIGLTILLLPP